MYIEINIAITVKLIFEKEDSMYNIGICDDDAAYRLLLIEMLCKVNVIKRNEMKFFEYDSGEDFAIAIHKHHPFDLVIIDMALGGIDGDVVARLFRKENPSALLVFCSGVCKPTVKSFEANAFRFLLKDFESKEMLRQLTEILIKMKSLALRKPAIITYHYDATIVPQDDIVMITRKKHGSVVTVINRQNNMLRELPCNKSLEELVQDLDPFVFASPHYSYCVNLSYVTAYTVKGLTLAKGIEISVTRSKALEFKAAFVDYCSNLYEAR